uniref:Uncharacterized protein n=1 Tax=Caenorhabditis tropicalis TaxID=1561998 RepID=A0A1I7UDY0_9PELO
MSIAFKWFSKYPEDQMQHFKIVVCGPSIYFHFKFAAELFLQKSIRRAPSARYLIMYIENESSTQVACPERNIQVEESMIQVFCEDFKEFLINRITILESLDMRGLVDERTIYDQIFECMESAFNQRNEKLQVKNVRFDIFDPKQVIELLRFNGK